MAERRSNRSHAARLRPLIPLAIIWFVGLALLLGLVAQRQVPYDQLLLDPNNLNKVPWYTGLVSNLGILGWTTATATAFFGSGVARYGNRQAAASMLRRGGVLSCVLLFDDLFQLHVAVKPLFGVSKSMVYVAYLAVAGWWFVTQFREIRRTRVELLIAAGIAFAGSVIVDQVGADAPGLSDQSALLVEDACKFLGVLAWALYFVMTSRDIVRSIVNQLRRGIPAPDLASALPDFQRLPSDGSTESDPTDTERYDVAAANASGGATRNRTR